jgi:hypothetical protein
MLRTILIVCILILSCAAHPHEKMGACPDYVGMIQHGKIMIIIQIILLYH